MDNAGYTTLTRQSGLQRAMESVANNLANMSTTGYRREGVIFSEFVQDLGPETSSLSMAAGRVREMDLSQGSITETGARFDFAIEGEGFFLLATETGERLTRNGAFTRSDTGDLVTSGGDVLLDAGGAPVFAPPDATAIVVAADGTLSADGQPLSQIGLWEPVDPGGLVRAGDAQFIAPGGAAPTLGETRILQGFLEGSNVNPVSEITRMIEVQRAYELGQNFLDKEDERIRSVMRTLGQ
ncbi:MAG: flagellar hook-basal body complex protein [Pseudomonadota bacterium]